MGKGLHSNAAFAKIYSRIRRLDADGARKELRKIGKEMENGTFKF